MSGTTTLPPYLFDAARAAEEAKAAAEEEAEKEGKESLWNPEFLRTTKGMLLVAQVVSHLTHVGPGSIEKFWLESWLEK